MMEGPKLAKIAVSSFLSNRMPIRLVTYRDSWNRSTSELPDPKQYTTYEPMALDKWPSVITVCMNTSSLVREDYSDDNPEYGMMYHMRTYVWAKAIGARAVTEMRDELTTVMRDLLLDVPGLDDASCTFRVEEDSIREEFSDLTLLKGERILAAAYIAYDLHSTEVMERDVLGVVGWGTDKGVVLALDLIEAVPNAPTVARAEAIGSSSISLAWNASTWEGGRAVLTGYKIESSTDGGTSWATAVADTATRDAAYTLTGLTVGYDYQFRVAGLNSEGVGATSASSNVVTAT